MPALVAGIYVLLFRRDKDVAKQVRPDETGGGANRLPLFGNERSFFISRWRLAIDKPVMHNRAALRSALLYLIRSQTIAAR
jgi:hypothetical protein